jgi:hypothetical protein
MTDLASTPWVDRAANATWARIVAAAPYPSWVPLHTTKRGGKITVKEYGCGHYGCVMPTDDPEVVCKITSDATEAVFVAASATLGEPPEGIVRYHGIYELVRSSGAAKERERLLQKAAWYEERLVHEEAARMRRWAEEQREVDVPVEHRGRRLFVLWREAATEVGLPKGHFFSQGQRSYEELQISNLWRALGHFKDAAAAVRDALKRSADPFALIAESKRFEEWAWSRSREIDVDRVIGSAIPRILGPFRGAQRLALALLLCDLIAENMENTTGCDLVGSALRYYLGEGILLADVHANNVGKVERTSGWVITDPGHAVGLQERWRTVAVPRLP